MNNGKKNLNRALAVIEFMGEQKWSEDEMSRIISLLHSVIQPSKDGAIKDLTNIVGMIKEFPKVSRRQS